MPSKPRLLDQVRAKIRRKRYSLRTEKACVGWIRYFALPDYAAAPGETAFYRASEHL